MLRTVAGRDQSVLLSGVHMPRIQIDPENQKGHKEIYGSWSNEETRAKIQISAQVVYPRSTHFSSYTSILGDI